MIGQIDAADEKVFTASVKARAAAVKGGELGLSQSTDGEARGYPMANREISRRGFLVQHRRGARQSRDVRGIMNVLDSDLGRTLRHILISQAGVHIRRYIAMVGIIVIDILHTGADGAIQVRRETFVNPDKGEMGILVTNGAMVPPGYAWIGVNDILRAGIIEMLVLVAENTGGRGQRLPAQVNCAKLIHAVQKGRTARLDQAEGDIALVFLVRVNRIGVAEVDIEQAGQHGGKVG